jgi:two-component system, NarL family, response regulator NreC
MFTRQSISVAIADDHEVVRFGFERLIARHRHPHLVCVGSVGDGNAVIELAIRSRPDVVVMDVRMPLCDGLDATSRLRKLVPETHVLAFSSSADATMVPAALRAGAIGYVCKTSDSKIVIDAICTVARGKRFVDPALMDQVLGRMFQDEIVVPSPPLSGRERAVLVGIATGHTNAELATELGLSIKTVEGYRARACEKLGLRTRSDLVQYALSTGLLVA